MIDLPPDIPVISACAPAVESGWRDAEVCLQRHGFTYAEPKESLIEIETDYWAAVDLLLGHAAFEEEISAADVKTYRQLSIENLDDPFLTVNFDNDKPAVGWEIHRVLTSPDYGVAIILDDSASTSLMLLSASPWAGFDELFANPPNVYQIKEEADFVRQVSLVQDYEMSFVTELYYTFFPSAYPDAPDWSLLQVESDSFQQSLGRPSNFTFAANYQIVREW